MLIAINDIVKDDSYRDFCANLQLLKDSALLENIKQYGVLMPVVLDENNKLLDGFTRVAVCEILDIKEIPYVTRRCDEVSGESNASACGRRKSDIQLHLGEDSKGCDCHEEG